MGKSCLMLLSKPKVDYGGVLLDAHAKIIMARLNCK